MNWIGRMQATLRKPGESMSPRKLRRTLQQLLAIVDPAVSEVEGGLRAKDLALSYGAASAAERLDLWLLMSEQFVTDPALLEKAQARFAAAIGTPDEATAAVNFRRETVSPRRRLLQRFSAYPGGVRFLVDVRAELQPALKTERRLKALDVEMEYMFSTWFDVGFLDLRRISWDSPASLIEKLILYEAVHDIRSWADVKNRLDSDRRCYGFFHPRLPDEPLIFVEVALADHISTSITPLLDEAAAPTDLRKASTATFHSISNTLVGLRGVGFGDSLIKRVVELLQGEFPGLKTFATLSPIPGFRSWMQRNTEAMLARLDVRSRGRLERAVGQSPVGATQLFAMAEKSLGDSASSPVRQFMLRSAAHYLGQEWERGAPLDPVARFHLGNGARVERLNWAADPLPKGLKQSCAIMVNYLYDLKRLDKHRSMLARGKIPMGTDVTGLQW